MAALVVAALTPALAPAQHQQGATQPATPAVAAAPTAPPINAAAELAIKQMDTRLRNLLAAQERHYSDHGTYTTSMSALGKYDPTLAPPRVVASARPSASPRRDSVSVQVIFAGGRGWTGIASHWGLRGKTCVVFVGLAEELPRLPITRTDRKTPAEEGVPTCDAPPPPPGGAAPAVPAPQVAPAAQPPARQ